MIRKAVPADIDDIICLGLDALEINSYEGLSPSKVKMFSLGTGIISSANHFCWVAEKDGKIVGAVSALTHSMMVFQGSQSSVIQFYCTEPGEGIKLIREFMKWVKSRPAIKMVVFTLEVKADPRIGKLLSRLGLELELPVYMKLM
jgi:hypothetical protein